MVVYSFYEEIRQLVYSVSTLYWFRGTEVWYEYILVQRVHISTAQSLKNVLDNGVRMYLGTEYISTV